uniref:Uncharacterized protein n=1 Tax=Tanacetum cinerariifolium TaxID=118510 RepID=A0A6L2NLW3_TANCI|nr:hypothetical protein [Tanacetum cinerariifolium]
MTSLEMLETKAYKTYLCYPTGVTPPKKARKFKKPASPKLSIVLASPEEPIRKSKRAKRPTKKSSGASTAGVVIRETHVKSLYKKKEKMTIEKRKGIDFLSKVALTEEAQYEEVRKKSLMDFPTTHPSGSGTVTKIAPSAAKIKPSVTNEGTGAKPGVKAVSKRDSGDVNTKSDSEKGSDFEHETVENESVTTNEGFIQKEGTDAEMTNVQQGNENTYITLNQVIEDAHVTLSTIPRKTKVPVTSSSHSSDLASKFLIFSDIPHTHAEIVSPMDVHVHHKIPKSLEHAVLAKESSQPKSTYKAAATLTEFELKKILIDKMDEIQSYLTAIEHKECYDGLIESYDHNKNRGLKKRNTNKDAEPTKGPKSKKSKSSSSKGTKSQSTSSGKFVHAEELEFEVTDFNMPQDPEENLGNNNEEPTGKVASKRDWFTKPKQHQEPIDPDWNVGKTLQQGPTKSRLMTLASFADKPSKTFDKLEGDFLRLRINDIEDMLILIVQNGLTNLSAEGKKDDEDPRKVCCDEVLKLKKIKKDGYTRFQHQEQYEHVGLEVTRSQEGKRSQDDDKRLCLIDDLKKVQDSHTSQACYNKLKPKVNDHYNISQVEVKKTSLRAQD